MTDDGTRLAGRDTRAHPDAPVRRRWSVRTYAFAALLVAVVPLLASLLFAQYQEDRAERERATGGPLTTARIAATEIGQHIEEVRHLLEFLTAVERRPSDDPERLCAMFPRLGPDWLAYGAFAVVRVDGTPVCDTHSPTATGHALVERDWFRRIVAGQPFAVGAPHAGQQGQRHIVDIAVPVRDTQNALVAVLSYGIDLERFVPPILYMPPVVEGRIVAYAAADGGAITHLRDRRAAGEIVAALATADAGRIVAADPGTDPLVYGFAKLANAEWAVVVAEPRDALPAERPGQSAWWRVLIGVLLCAALLLAAGLILRAVRPLEALADTASHDRAGGGTPRAPASGPAEVAVLAHALNARLDEHAAADRVLSASTVRYGQLAETMQDAVLVLDRELRIVFANAAALKVFGQAPARLAGEPVARLLAPGALARILPGPPESWLAAAADGSPVAVEVGGVRAGGEAFPLAVTRSVRHIDGDAVVVVCCKDLTSRRLSERRLRESEAQFRALTDFSPALVWTTDAAGGCAYANPAWLAYTGRTSEQERGDGWNDSVSRYDVDRRRKAIGAACAERKPLRLECRRAGRDGTYRWFVETGAPWYDGAGRFVGLIGTSIDIHERVIAEHRMRRLADMQSALMQVGAAAADAAAPRAFLQHACDILLQFGGFNVAWIALLDADGQGARMVANSGHVFHMLHDRHVRFDGADELAGIPAMVALREGHPVVLNHRLEDPRTIPLRDSAGDPELRSMAAFPLRMAGSVCGVLAVFSPEVEAFDEELCFLLEMLASNITAKLDSAAVDARRTDAEQALRQVNATLEEKIRERTESVGAANRALEAANRELESFSYSVSHDLRAPLRSISGFSDLLQMNYGEALDTEARAYLDRIKAASLRMTVLINDLLNLSRIARAPLTRVRVDLSRIAEEALAHLVELEPGRRVETRIEPDLGASADAGLVAIALTNLLDNAWKFTAREPAAVIEFGHVEIGGQLRYYVRDNGAGFDMAYADKLFAPFQRLHREADFAGTGIGLAIVQRIFARHGGKIWAESAPARGATFWFTLGGEGSSTTQSGMPERV